MYTPTLSNRKSPEMSNHLTGEQWRKAAQLRQRQGKKVSGITSDDLCKSCHKEIAVDEKFKFCSRCMAQNNARCKLCNQAEALHLPPQRACPQPVIVPCTKCSILVEVSKQTNGLCISCHTMMVYQCRECNECDYMYPLNRDHFCRSCCLLAHCKNCNIKISQPGLCTPCWKSDKGLMLCESCNTNYSQRRFCKECYYAYYFCSSCNATTKNGGYQKTGMCYDCYFNANAQRCASKTGKKDDEKQCPNMTLRTYCTDCYQLYKDHVRDVPEWRKSQRGKNEEATKAEITVTTRLQRTEQPEKATS